MYILFFLITASTKVETLIGFQTNVLEKLDKKKGLNQFLFQEVGLQFNS